MQAPTLRTNIRLHNEPISSFKQLMIAWGKALFQPEIRLTKRLPWGLKEFSKYCAIGAVYYVLGSFIPLILIFGGVYIASLIMPDQIMPYVAQPDGHPKTWVILATTMFSFVTGFGAELYYVHKLLAKRGLNVFNVIGLNLKTLNGSWTEAFRRSVVALACSLLLQNLLEFLPAAPKPHQAAAAMASSLDTSGVVGFTVLAALLAPFFEEVIFRGFVFNSCRNIFSEGRIFRLLGQNKRVADYAAIGVSALLFAGAHMDASAFLQLFVIGIVLAELYRRTGSLVCPMMLHAMNNAMATYFIVSR